MNSAHIDVVLIEYIEFIVVVDIGTLADQQEILANE